MLTQHIEHILALTALLWLVCRRNLVGFGLAAVFWGVYFFLRPENTGFVESFGEHPLSAWHIWLSWSARFFILNAAVHAITVAKSPKFGAIEWGGQAPCGAISGRDVQTARLYQKYAPTPDAGLHPATPPNHTLRFLIILQSLSMLTGMIWAFDNFAWGALWQWDSIELISLVIWFAIVNNYRNPTGQTLWSWVSILAILIQIELLLAPGHLVSRHDFFAEKIPILWTAFLALWLTMLGVFARRRHQNREVVPLERRDVFSAIVLVFLGLLPLTPYHASVRHTALWAIFILLWIVLWIRPLRRLPLCLGVLTLACAMIMPSGADRPLQAIHRAKLDTPDYQLAGVQTTQENGCMRYHFNIARGGEIWELPYQTCDSAIPPQAVDVWDGMIPRRIWVLDYKAAQGVQLLVRNIAPERLFELWLVLLCLWFAAVPIKMPRRI